MEFARVSCAKSRFGLACTAGLGLLLACAAIAGANMQPPTQLLLHVQPWDPWGSACNPSGVSRCEDLVQATGEAGDLLVVVYLVTGYGPYGVPGPISHVDFTLQWGGWWWGSIVANCTDAQLSYEDNYYSVTVHLDWPNHPYPSEFMPLCAFWTQANGHDCIEILGDGGIHWGYPQGWWETPIGGRAEAGAECEYSCVMACNPWNDANVPVLTPEELHLEVIQGQEAEGLLHAVTNGWAGGCAFDATESWVTVEATPTSYYTADVRVIVSALGLSSGQYEARVRATCDARDCSRIYLTVTEGDPQTIPDDDGALGPDLKPPSSWGAVKDLYRGR